MVHSSIFLQIIAQMTPPLRCSPNYSHLTSHHSNLASFFPSAYRYLTCCIYQYLLSVSSYLLLLEYKLIKWGTLVFIVCSTPRTVHGSYWHAINSSWMYRRYLPFTAADPLSLFFPVSSVDKISGLLCPLISAYTETQQEFGRRKDSEVWVFIPPCQLPQVYHISGSKIIISPKVTHYMWDLFFQ